MGLYRTEFGTYLSMWNESATKANDPTKYPDTSSYSIGQLIIPLDLANRVTYNEEKDCIDDQQGHDPCLP
jgi:hypothetical protein